MIAGIDVGYTNTKYYTRAKQGLFKSTVQEGVIDINKSITLDYEGKEYTIGEKGAYSVDLNKVDDITFKLCLYAAVAQVMRYGVEEIDLVTGLPIAYYSKQKLTLKNALEGKEIFIKFKGEQKLFTINRALVFPQSAGLVVLNPSEFKGNVIIIDIGGMTIDVSYFEGTKLIKYATYPNGMLKLYGKIIQHLNAEYGLNLSVLDGERLITEDLYINDVKVDWGLKGFLEEHTEEILRPIKLEFPYLNSKKVFIGGGAVTLKDFLPRSVAIKEDDIYANAMAFCQIGVEKFGY